MYLMCKEGFVEADRWDGARLPDANGVEAHRVALGVAIAAARDGRVTIARSRERSTLLELVAFVRRDVPVLESPAGWDYPFRVYLTADEWAVVMAAIGDDLDYRNFKSWCAANAPAPRKALAHDLWSDAFWAVRRG